MSNALVFGVRSLVIKNVLTDPEVGNITYGSDIPVVGINSASVSMSQEQVEARGDDIVQGVVSNPAGVVIDLSIAKTNLEAAQLFIGGTFTCATALDTFTLKGNEYAGYIGIEFIGITDDNKVFTVTLAKAKAASYAMNFADKGFASPTVQVTGVPAKDLEDATGTPMLTITLVTDNA